MALERVVVDAAVRSLRPDFAVLALAVSPVTAAALLLPIYVVSDVFGIWAYRRHYNRRLLAILVPATTLGIGIGWFTAAMVPVWAVTLLIGAIGVAFTANAWLKRDNAAPPRPADVLPVTCEPWPWSSLAWVSLSTKS